MIPKAEATRLRIIEVAADLMGTRGYGRTGLEQILERSGVSRGNLYHHFPSKEDLGFAVLDHLGARIAGFLQSSMADVEDPLDRIDAMLDALAAGASARNCRGGCPLGNLAAEMSDVNEAFRARLERIFGTWRELVAVNLEEGARRRGRAGVDVDGLARYILCCLEGSMLMAKVNRKVLEVRDAVGRLKGYVRQQLASATG